MRRPLIYLIILHIFVNELYAQGCSDGGVCTAGNLKPENSVSDTSSFAGVTFIYGQGENKVNILTLQPELNFNFIKSALEIKLPFHFIYGELSNRSGIGDPVITYTHEILKRKKLAMNFFGGLRISTGRGDEAEGELPLPMVYQENLGTTDILIGLSGRLKNFLSFGIGIQQPVINYNRNEFFEQAGGEYSSYFNSYHLNRKGDGIVRADGLASVGKLNLTAGVVWIYHLSDDEITGEYAIVPAKGSKGTTLNATAGFSYSTPKIQFSLTGAAPFVTRNNRPEGLTRHWVVGMTLKGTI